MHISGTNGTMEELFLLETSTKAVPFDECYMIQEKQTSRSFYPCKYVLLLISLTSIANIC